MPNTFSMAPRYVRDFAARTAFPSPERDAFDRLEREARPALPRPAAAAAGIALLGDARDAGPRASAALRARGLPDRARLVLTSPPYLRVVKYGYYNWLRTWFLGFDSKAIDASLDDAHHRAPYLEFLREVLARPPAGADGRRNRRARHRRRGDRPRRAGPGRHRAGGAGLGAAAAPEGYGWRASPHDDVHAVRKMTKLWGREAGRATQVDRILVLGATESGRRRALAAASLESTGPGRHARCADSDRRRSRLARPAIDPRIPP